MSFLLRCDLYCCVDTCQRYDIACHTHLPQTFNDTHTLICPLSGDMLCICETKCGHLYIYSHFLCYFDLCIDSLFSVALI